MDHSFSQTHSESKEQKIFHYWTSSIIVIFFFVFIIPNIRQEVEKCTWWTCIWIFQNCAFFRKKYIFRILQFFNKLEFFKICIFQIFALLTTMLFSLKLISPQSLIHPSKTSVLADLFISDIAITIQAVKEMRQKHLSSRRRLHLKAQPNGLKQVFWQIFWIPELLWIFKVFLKRTFRVKNVLLSENAKFWKLVTKV